MPELPEVETIRRGLTDELIKQRVDCVDIVFAKSMPVSDHLVQDQVIGKRIINLRRQGKVLIIDLDSHYSLLVHLKMTGQLVLRNTDGSRSGGGHPTKSLINELPDSTTRVILSFDGGKKLYFNDQRKFGWIKLLETDEVENDSLLARMGDEPLSDRFSPESLAVKLVRRKTSIKAVLLDQSTVAGLGNIYVDEALHLARIHPARSASDISVEETKRLHRAIVDIISLAIRLEGTTFRNFMNHSGASGNYFAHARVFGRTGQACGVCATPIDKIRIAGRGTHICPRCQKQ